MKRANFMISEVHIKRLKVMATRKGVSMSEVLRYAIDEYWRKFKKGGD
jgi:hypothetical protein